MTLLAILLPILIHRAIAAEFFHRISGEYRIQWRELGPCAPEKRGTNEIFIDVHLTKRRQGVTEMNGKYTFLIPFDDNITMNINFAVLNSNSVWIPNAYSIPVPKLCSSLKTILQDAWVKHMKDMGIVPKCPVPKGVYEMKDYDVNYVLHSTLIPKEFFYGRYKVIVEFRQSKKLVGCAYTILEIVPRVQKGSKKN